MAYDFDKVIDRHGTGAMAVEVLNARFGRPDITPMWVADMDFATPQFIIDAMRQRLEHPIFGYTMDPADYWPSVIDWIQKRHGWKVEREWLSYIPGIVKGIGMAINVFVKEDEKVIIQPPVYHPFRLTTLGNKRGIVYNPLRETADGSYDMDFDNLAEVADEKCRMLVLSNPHNPGGVVWSKETLARLADFCYKRNILVVSDEIHADMALYDNVHTPFATASAEAAANSITFGAPSKTFNIAGIVSSYAVIPNKEIRERFYGWMEANELNEAPLFSPIVTVAAFRQGEQWRKEMLHYIEGNVDYVMDYIEKNIPQIRPWRPQASFLVWLDCRGLDLDQKALVSLFVDKAHLALNDGSMFGKEGTGFMRMNIGCPRSKIKDALERLNKAING